MFAIKWMHFFVCVPSSSCCSSITEVWRGFLGLFSFPSWPFSAATLMKWSCLTNTNRASREPRLLPATAATETEWEWIPAWSALLLSLSVIFSVSHSPCLCRPVHSVMIMWRDTVVRRDVCQQQKLCNAWKAASEIPSYQILCVYPYVWRIFAKC